MKYTYRIALYVVFTLQSNCYLNADHSEHIRANMFGTDGIRSTVGTAPLTAHDLHNMGKALGRWIVNKYGENATVLCGHDTRLSCSFVKSALKSGLLLYRINLVDAEILPTPAVFQLTLKYDQFDCGIVISASHNPYQDNGIKIIDKKQGKLNQEDEQSITAFYYNPEPSTYMSLGQERYWTKAKDTYINYLQQFFSPAFLRGTKIILDCAHGATVQLALKIFKAFDAEVICIGNKPNGTNINEQCGAVHPERLAHMVLKHKADAGFAFDGDGDRVIAVNNKGEIKDGDDILALLLDHPAYHKMTTIVGTIMTNKGFQDYLHSRNRTLIRTPVGDKYIVRRLQQDNLLMGGEQSGHIILQDYLPTGDGIFTALRVMEAIIYADNKQMITFEHYPQLLINVPIKEKKDLTQEPFTSIIKNKRALLPHGRIEVRFSGTENKLRVMVEDSKKELAETVGHQLAYELQEALKG